jgi:hypothetical protein
MAIITTNIMAVKTRKALDNTWLSSQPISANHMDFMSLPLDQRMTWVTTNVMPVFAAARQQRDTVAGVQDSNSTRVAHNRLKLRAVGADKLLSHADKLGVSGFQTISLRAKTPT